MRSKLLALALIILWGRSVCIAGDEGYAWPGVAVGAKVGTLGLGGDLTVGLGPYANLRAGGNYFAFAISRTIHEVDYRLNLDMITFPILLDVHPFANNFRISGGGVFYAQAKAELKGVLNKDVTFGDHKYSRDEIGELSGSVEAGRKIAPYIGLGYGNAVGPDTTWSFVFDLGVALQTYDVELSAEVAGIHPSFPEDLAKEQQKIQDEADKFKIYPVLAFGIAYHF